MGGVFYALFKWTSRNRGLSLLFGLLFFAACFWFISNLKTTEDITALLPSSAETTDLAVTLHNPGFKDRIVIHLFLEDTAQANPERLIKVAQLLQPEFDREFSPFVLSTSLKQEEDALEGLSELFWENLPYFLNEDDYEELRSRFTQEGIEATITSVYRTLLTPAGFALKNRLLNDPFGLTGQALSKLENLRYSERLDLSDGYLFAGNGKSLISFMETRYPAGETGKNEPFVSGLEKFQGEVSEKFPDVRLEFFGGPVVAVANSRCLKRDIIVSISIAAALLVLLISVYFRSALAFPLVFLPALLGGLSALAGVSLLQNTVSLIALAVGSILLGISVDFSLHILAWYRAGDKSEKLFKELATPVVTASLTTASAFLCLFITGSSALHQLGLFAAFAIGFGAFFSLLFLPFFGKKLFPQGRMQKPALLDRLAAIPFHENKKLVWAVGLIAALLIFLPQRPGFMRNLNEVNYVPADLQLAENRLDDLFDYKLKTFFLTGSGSSLDEALERSESAYPVLDSLRKSGLIKEVFSPKDLLLSAAEKEAKHIAWKQFWQQTDTAALRQSVEAAGIRAGFKPATFNGFFEHLSNDFSAESGSLDTLLRHQFFKGSIIGQNGRFYFISLLKAAEEDKAALYAAFSKQSTVSLLDRQIIFDRFVLALEKDFEKLVKISLVFVFLLLSLSFGRLETAFLTFVPLLISWGITLGIMGLFDIRFNMFNLVISTFVFGLGIDYCLFVARSLLHNYKYGEDNFPNFKSAILVSALTSIIGIGVLIFARHPALRSIAAVSVAGLVSVVTVAFVLQPVFFRWFILRRKRIGRFPVTLYGAWRTLYTWFWLIFSVVTLAISGAIIHSLLFLNVWTRRAWFNKVFQKVSRLYLFLVFDFEKMVMNPTGEKFEKPCILVCNHQSLIENPMLMMHLPKSIILTNDWVLNSPVFGLVGRLAGFVSPSLGVEALAPELGEHIKRNYTIVVFPEGTRSVTGKFGRFHKGAFYLAEALNLDIVPVVFHGTGNFLLKGAFWGRHRPVKMKILGRFPLNDPATAAPFAKRAKIFKNLMEIEYKEMIHTFETPEYHTVSVIENYIYKGPVLEWYLRIKLRVENNYLQVLEHLPEKGHITDLGCGYGFLSYMMYFMGKERTITGVDYDEEKIAVAQNCPNFNPNLNFETADLTNYQPQSSAAIVLYDVLHYLRPEAQEALLQRCINALLPGGVLLIRDGNPEAGKKHFGTRLTELFSIRLLGFNKSVNELHFPTAADLEKAAKSGSCNLSIKPPTGWNSNSLYVLRKPSSDEAV